MSPYIAVGAAVALLCAYGVGRLDGARIEQAQQDRASMAVQEAAQKSREATAKAIAAIRVRNTTIQQTLEKEVRNEPVYLSPDCRVTPGGMRALNEALAGSEPSPSSLPASESAH